MSLLLTATTVKTREREDFIDARRRSIQQKSQNKKLNT